MRQIPVQRGLRDRRHIVQGFCTQIVIPFSPEALMNKVF